MKLYDSATNKLYEVINKQVSIYNCGPTVYNDIHIGNARPLITFDVLYRYLETLNYQVTYIHNITDIDDKIINKAKSLSKTEKEIATIYYQNYVDIMRELNIKPMTLPKVSENMQAIIDYINKLVQGGWAYVKEGDVYFDVSKSTNYGFVSHQNIDALLAGVRKQVNPKKNNPLDFTLWKQTEVGLNWKTPWSTGRPGWHTECAVLINKYVGDHVTIHGGGIDLKFPHHENENAQNQALFKRNIADIWMHVGHIDINNEKMSKSVGNFVLVKDLLKKYSGGDIRWFIYQSKYQNPLNFSEELLEKSSETKLKLYQQINAAFIQMALNDYQPLTTKAILPNDFVTAMNEDLDLPNAITAIWKYTKGLNKLIRNKDYATLSANVNNLIKTLEILGLTYWNPSTDPVISSLISEWKNALQQKNYSLADSYRQKLMDMRIISG